MRCPRLLLAVLVLASGCDLYWNSTGDDVCNGYGYGGIAPSQDLRNPVTGDCEYFGGGDYPCDSACGPCPATTEGAPQADPDWGQCYGSCNALDEASCLTTSGCLATYDDVTTHASFRGCFATAPSGPVSTGACYGLDAHECSRHDNCAMYYDAGLDALVPGQFTRCAPEPTTAGCSAVDCGPGYHCADQCTDPCPPNGACTMNPTCTATCVPDADSCANVDCGPGYECVQTCGGGTPTPNGMVPGTCSASCVEVTACEALATENDCAQRSDCTTVYNGEDCTCYPNQGCTCQVLTYDHCESLTAQPL